MRLCKNPVSLPDAAAIQNANISTGNPEQCPATTNWFPQLIDHSKPYDAPNNTFHQQYQLIDKYFKPGGPILFWQSVEGPYVCTETSILLDMAEKIGALIIGLEHRYFGNSCPYGLNYTEKASWDPKVLEPLTLDSVLMDGVTFITWVKTVAYPAAENAKAIVISGTHYSLYNNNINSNKRSRILWGISCPAV